MTEPSPSRSVATVLLPFVPGLLVLAGVAAINAASHEVSFFSMMADPVSVTGAHVTTGMVSLLVSGLWATAATAAAVGAATLRRVDRPLAGFLGWSALLSAVLFLDDTFLLHEAVLPGLLDVPEEVTLGAFALGFLAIAASFRRVILRTDVLLLGTAGLLLAGSVAVDVLQDVIDLPAHIFVEDGLKLLAVFGWAGYFLRTTVASLRAAVDRAPGSHSPAGQDRS